MAKVLLKMVNKIYPNGTHAVINVDFEVKDTYITLLSSLLLTVIVAYFGSRGIEKYHKIKKR